MTRMFPLRFTRPLALLLGLGACGAPPDALEPGAATTSSALATGTGLLGEYFDNADFTALKVVRVDATVNASWGTGAPAPGVGVDTFSVRWTGQVEAPVTGTYTFHATTDNGRRLWVNGVRIIDRWIEDTLSYSGTVSLTAGQRYDIQLEMYENTGSAGAKLEWSAPGLTREVIPSNRLYPAPAGPGALAPNLYVAPTGSDTGPGTLAQPFRTVQRCASVAVAGQTCLLRAGTYRETVRPALSGTLASPLRFVGYPGEVATLSGATPVTGWQLHQGSIYKASVTLPVNGYSDTGFFANQVFVNGAMQWEARWPNPTATSTLFKPPLAGGYVNSLNGSSLDAVVTNAGIPALPEGWAGATVWANEWYTSRTGTVTDGGAGSLTARMHAPYTRNAYWFYLTGKLGLLDVAGEWHYDGTAQLLYLWAPGGGVPQGVEAKVRNLAFDLTSRSYIHVKDVSLFAATLTSSADTTGIVLDGVTAKYVSHHVTLPPLPTSAQAPGSDNALVLASHAHDTGVQLRGTGHVLKNSEVAFSAGNVVLLEGSGHLVENNLIHDGDYASTYAAPLRINGNGHRILRNTLFNAGRSAIEVDWHTNGFSFKNAEIAYNDISRFGALSSDLGGLYICCFTDMTGTRIHHNSVHDPYGYSFHWDAAGIYTDNWSYNSTIHHNIVWNIRTNRPKSLKVASNPDRAGLERVYNNVLLAPVNLPTGTLGDIRNNIFRATPAFTGTGVSHNLFSDTDPLFVNAAGGDFRLATGSPAVDTGAVLPPFTDGFTGTAPDIGAFESGLPAWTAGATRP